MPFALERFDQLDRVEADRPIGTAVMLTVSLAIAFESRRVDSCLIDRGLRHSAARAMQRVNDAFLAHGRRTARWIGHHQRTRGDSNSRDGFPPTRFPGVRLKPLGHPSPLLYMRPDGRLDGQGEIRTL